MEAPIESRVNILGHYSVTEKEWANIHTCEYVDEIAFKELWENRLKRDPVNQPKVDFSTHKVVQINERVTTKDRELVLGVTRKLAYPTLKTISIGCAIFQHDVIKPSTNKSLLPSIHSLILTMPKELKYSIEYDSMRDLAQDEHANLLVWKKAEHLKEDSELGDLLGKLANFGKLIDSAALDFVRQKRKAELKAIDEELKAKLEPAVLAVSGPDLKGVVKN
jgi:hypothetical protein